MSNITSQIVHLAMDAYGDRLASVRGHVSNGDELDAMRAALEVAEAAWKKSSPEHQTDMLMARMVLNQVGGREAQHGGAADLQSLRTVRSEIEGLAEAGTNEERWLKVIDETLSALDQPRPVVEQPSDSTTLTSLITMFRQREQVGLAKYGATVDRTDLTNAQWRQHLREELMDALLYSLREEQTMGERVEGAVAFVAISKFSGPVLQPLEGFDRLPVGNHNLYTRPAASQPADVECPKCGSKSVDEASTRCIPDSFGDSCPGCEEPIASAWDNAAQPRPMGGVPDETDAVIDAMVKIVTSECGEDFSTLDPFTLKCLRDTQRQALRAAREVAAALEVPRG